MDSVPVTVVITIEVLKVEHITLSKSLLPKVGSILFVLLVYIVAALESVKVATDVLLTSMDVI